MELVPQNKSKDIVMKRLFILILLLSVPFLSAMQKSRQRERSKSLKPTKGLPQQILAKNSERIIDETAFWERSARKYYPLDDLLCASIGQFHEPDGYMGFINPQAKLNSGGIIFKFPPFYWLCSAVCNAQTYFVYRNEQTHKVNILHLNDEKENEIETNRIVNRALCWNNKIILDCSGKLFFYNPTSNELENQIDLTDRYQHVKVQGDYLIGYKKPLSGKIITINKINLNNEKRETITLNQKNNNLKEADIIDLFWVEKKKKVIVAYNKFFGCSYLQVFDLENNQQKTIQTYKIQMVKPIGDGDYIITAAGSIMRVFNTNLELVQEVQLEDRNLTIQKIWITGTTLCSQVNPFDKKRNRVDRSCSALVGWELRPQEKTVEPIKDQQNNLADWQDWREDDECGCCVVS